MYADFFQLIALEIFFFFIFCIVWGSLALASPCWNFRSRTSDPPALATRGISQSRLFSNAATLFAFETKPKAKVLVYHLHLSGNNIMFHFNWNSVFYLPKPKLFVQFFAQIFHFQSFLLASRFYPCKNFQSRLQSASSVAISTLRSL